MVIGRLTTLPYNSSNGDKPVDSWRTPRLANNKGLIKRCHCLGCSLQKLFNINFILTLNFSVKPLHIGWQGVVVICLILRNRVTSFMQSETNCVPMSLKISSGIPNLLKIQLNPAISKSLGNEKKFEIAGFRNNRGSVKLVTMNHFLIKYSTV